MTGELVAWEDADEAPYLEHAALRLDFADGGRPTHFYSRDQQRRH